MYIVLSVQYMNSDWRRRVREVPAREDEHDEPCSPSSPTSCAEEARGCLLQESKC